MRKTINVRTKHVDIFKWNFLEECHEDGIKVKIKIKEQDENFTTLIITSNETTKAINNVLDYRRVKPYVL